MGKQQTIDAGCRKIFSHYKYENQKRKLWEEFGELLSALTTIQHTTKGRAFENVAEEIADVMVMVRQFQLHFAISDEHIKKVMQAKVERTIERMNNDVTANLKDVSTNWK